jgi:hypothetical protein
MRSIILAAIAILFAPSASSSAAAAQHQAAPCQPAGPVAQLPGLAEASGLAVGRRTPARLWTHNDSGEPVLFALDARGTVEGRVRVTGASVEDWEAIAAGPCGSGSCLYVGDIGDNEARRKQITVYRVAEPEGASGSAAVTGVFRATYPDGEHDAEALLVAGDGRLHIVTKGETGPLALYRFPAQLTTDGTMRLERVGAPAGSKLGPESRVTDGSVSPDGQWVVLRTRSSLSYYRASEFFAGQWRVASRVDLTGLKEPQGEGIALGPANTVYLAGEGGGKSQPGSFVRFPCAPMS